MNKLEVKQNLIIKQLEGYGELSTSRIAHMISVNYNKAEDLLTDLEEKNKIESTITKRGVFWRKK